MLDLLLVGLGGCAGAQARFAVSGLAARRFGTRFPYGTVLINLSGSFGLGLFLALAARSFLAEDVYRWIVAVGFCGGYTTFSTYNYETLTMLRQGNLLGGLIGNWLGSYGLGLAAAGAGLGLGNLF